MWIYLLIALGLLIIVGMAAYAVKLLRALKNQKQALENARLARVKRLKESIEIIARAMQNGDCNLSEGAIRLKMLLDPLGLKITTYPALAELYDVVKEMPTHQARKELKKNERMRLDLTRESAEADLESKILLELNQLLLDIEKF
ncbi:DUF2489 domain-containing protein [Avibacterium gallinarum]|uniref:Transmembrane protein n=2 Tax=Avibacterium TaxID=292486 RepID=A0A379B0H7_AVIGA|nr:DUF2489 domain-containing protein [Avibacterium gallinarum]POY44235.1 DUF2489 domain-containing protein [Avibacterium gallinarum]TDP29234.1 uncharacterized protein DUF2489 [Avibacterium gallinarum]SUB28260.1 transmembrane protein [Avibacterium gallinarum]VGM95978.1 Protein of uncharacterised function (DUF2489) [uncultured Avibacterium sp.]